MNWLGSLIQKEISSNDTVLDFGCGIFQAYTQSLNQNKIGRKELKCKSLLGLELFEKYLDVAKNYFPVMKFNLEFDDYEIFPDNSFDVCLSLDSIEHINKMFVEHMITQMKRIARKKVIIYTPVKWDKNGDNVDNAWGLGENELQEHQSYISPEQLQKLGFEISFPKPDKNTFALWNKK